ncbi:MAG: hypothetical protein ACOC5K_01510 [Chloroflexota bacterium]
MNGDWLLQFGRDGELAALLVAGHAVASFVAQSPWMSSARRGRRWLPLQLLAVAAIPGAALLPLMSMDILSVWAALSVVHVAINHAFATAARRRAWLRPYALTAQAAHIPVLAAAWAFVSSVGHGAPFLALPDVRHEEITRAAVVAAAYAVNFSAAALVVGVVLRVYRLGITGRGMPEAESDSVARGRIIGVLERMIVLTLALIGQWGAVGLVVAAKSIARFDALKDRDFGEYYLIGTLASLLIASGSAALVNLLA